MDEHSTDKIDRACRIYRAWRLKGESFSNVAARESLTENTAIGYMQAVWCLVDRLHFLDKCAKEGRRFQIVDSERGIRHAELQVDFTHTEQEEGGMK